VQNTVTEETKNLIHQAINLLEIYIEDSIKKNHQSDNSPYDILNSKEYKEAIEYAIEMLFRLQQNHQNTALKVWKKYWMKDDWERLSIKHKNTALEIWKKYWMNEDWPNR
jgi:hypothetical protein